MKCVTLTHDRDGLTSLLGILGPDIYVECTDNSISSIRGGIKNKILVFFRKTPKGGGRGLAESEISLSEKNEICLDFFQKGVGGLTFCKRVL